MPDKTTLRRPALILAGAFGLMGTMPVTASATIHYGIATFNPPKEAPSIGAPPPACDQQIKEPWEAPEGECYTPKEGLQKVTVAYNDQTGSLTLKVAVYEPQYWGAVLPYEQFSLGRSCKSEELEGNFEGTGSIYQPNGQTSEIPNNVTLHGYKGTVKGSVNWTGELHVFTWTDPAFAHRDWRCLALAGGGTIYLGGWPAPSHSIKHPRARRRG